MSIEEENVQAVLLACPPVVDGHGWGDCTICMSPFSSTDPGLLLTCQHTFHHECLEQMLRTSGKCCLCHSVFIEVTAPSTATDDDYYDEGADFASLFASFPTEFNHVPDYNEEEPVDEAGQAFVYAECQALTRDDDGAFVMIFNSPAVSRHSCFPGWNPLTMPTIHAYNPLPVSQCGLRVASVPVSHTVLAAKASPICEFFVDISRPLSGGDLLLLRPHYWATGAGLLSGHTKSVRVACSVVEWDPLGVHGERPRLDGTFSACVHHSVASPWTMELEEGWGSEVVERSWRCGACSLLNDVGAACCEACDVGRPKSLPLPSTPQPASLDPPPVPAPAPAPDALDALPQSRLLYSLVTCPRGKQALTIHWAPPEAVMEYLQEKDRSESVAALVAALDAMMLQAPPVLQAEGGDTVSNKSGGSGTSSFGAWDVQCWQRVRECLLAREL